MRGPDRWLELALFGAAALLLWFGFGAPTWRRVEFDPGERAPDALRLCTWNVGGSGQRGLEPLRDENIAAIGASLEALAPDLVAFQEVGSEQQLRRLARASGHPDAALLLAPGSGRRVAAFARSGRLRRVALAVEDSRVLGFEYEDEQGRRLRGVVLHADAFSASDRNRLVGEATEALLAVAGDLPLVLLGDLNLDLDLGKRRDLFTDNEHLDVETYNFVAGKLSDAALGSGPTAEPDRRLDYVFVSMTALAVERAGVWRRQREGDMDHDPVVVDVRFER